MELRDYWRTIKRRWMTIVACLLLTVAVAGVVTWQTTPQYASTARLFVSTAPSDASQAYQGGLFATQRVASYADLIKSRQLAEQVSEDLGGALTGAELEGRVEAAVVPETVNLEITATDPDPVLARDIAQAYAEGLSALVADLETPDGPEEGADQGLDRRRRPDARRRRSHRSRSATSAWPRCSACCSASPPPCSATCWTPR